MGTEALYAALKGTGLVCAFDIELLGSFNLATNLALNGLEGKVENYFVAVGARPGYLQVGENTNYFSIPGRPKYDQVNKWVQVTTLDDCARTRGVWPSYVKIDVCGS